jgi:DNA-directed RNA polymerase specialized sigma24 family protein
VAEEGFTELFDRGRQGDSRALGLAYTLVFSQLRRTAARLLARERQGGTLQATALVSELYLRLNRLQCRVAGREHFLALAARSMKRHLIDRGRHRAMAERHNIQMGFAAASLVAPVNEEELAVRQVWERLRRNDSEAADVVWMLKVERMAIHEVAARLGMAPWRVAALSDYALQWMQGKLAGNLPAQRPG